MALKDIFNYTALFPFTYINTLWRTLDKTGVSILDVGCGTGQPIKEISRLKNFFTVGVDLFIPYLKMCKQEKTHDQYVRADVRFLPFRKKSFDIILALHIIEHLSRNNGLKLIKDMERIARKQVIISTPNGPCTTCEFDQNPLYIHKSYWLPEDFEHLGYKVIGYWLRIIWGDQGIARKLPQSLHILGIAISFLFAPLTYFITKPAAACIICVKTLTPLHT